MRTPRDLIETSEPQCYVGRVHQGDDDVVASLGKESSRSGMYWRVRFRRSHVVRLRSRPCSIGGGSVKVQAVQWEASPPSETDPYLALAGKDSLQSDAEIHCEVGLDDAQGLTTPVSPIMDAPMATLPVGS